MNGSDLVKGSKNVEVDERQVSETASAEYISQLWCIVYHLVLLKTLLQHMKCVRESADGQ